MMEVWIFKFKMKAFKTTTDRQTKAKQFQHIHLQMTEVVICLKRNEMK